MRKTTKIALAVGAALSLGLAAAELTAHPSGEGTLISEMAAR